MPLESGVEIAITEASGIVGMTVTSINIRLFSVGVGGAKGPLQVDYTLSAAEIAAEWGGSNHVGPGDTRVIAYKSAFPGGAHPEDGTAQANVYITDDNGNMTELFGSMWHQVDKCDSYGSSSP